VKRLRPRANFWAEIDGQVVLSGWRVRLLEAIDRSGSISGAAQEMDIPYKLAWERLHEMEERLGHSLVDAQVGGVGGGGTWLTPLAREYIQRWQQFSDGLLVLVIDRFADAFGGVMALDSQAIAFDEDETADELPD
jgi:molybdate transport system regulatory protein